MRSRFRLASVALGALILTGAAARAQQADDTWKDMVTGAQYAAAGNDFAQAEQLLVKALHQAERFAPDDWRVGTTLNDLGKVYRSQNKFADAETSYRRAIVILTKSNGADSAEVADVNFNIANALMADGHEKDAVPYIRQSLSTWEGQLGGASVQTASALCLLGDAMRLTANFNEAEPPLKRCADIRESDGGIANTGLADALHSLALTYVGQRQYAKAEPRFKLAEKIRENKLGLTSPLLAQTFEDHAAMLRAMGRAKEADRLAVLSAAIRRNEKKNK